MLRLLASLVILSLTRLSAAQFNGYPACVQPLLTRIFPANCLSLSLAAQNICLCTDASIYANALVKGLYQACGCADLQMTLQLSAAYCAQVDVDVGPTFSVFLQDDTPCSGGTGTGTSAGSGGSTSLAASSTGTATAVVASTPTGSNLTPVTVFVTSLPAGSSTNTAVGGGMSTVVASTSTGSNPAPVTVFVTSSLGGSSTNTAVGGGTTTVVVGPKNFAANIRVPLVQVIEVVLGVAGGLMAL
ncbi:Ferredoxin-fold anticodon-binding domain-containing protein 1 [Xylographa pallens]|nr:Ferredoxin-fold anticodon-binding domain-containing protein 1 [Xylographa pallens]